MAAFPLRIDDGVGSKVDALSACAPLYVQMYEHGGLLNSQCWDLIALIRSV
jgi:hypothetical protein